MKQGGSGFNDLEALYEIEVTPEYLRQVADSLEFKVNKGIMSGMVVRMKFNHMFCFVFRPEVKAKLTSNDDNAQIAGVAVNSKSLLSASHVK